MVSVTTILPLGNVMSLNDGIYYEPHTNPETVNVPPFVSVIIFELNVIVITVPVVEIKNAPLTVVSGDTVNVSLLAALTPVT